MNVKRFVWAAAFSLLCAAFARAESVPCFNDACFSIQTTGWNSDQSFTVKGSSTTASTAGFTEGSFTPCPYWWCFYDEDPGTKLNGAGDAIPFNGAVGAVFTGNTTVNYENVGFNLETVTITTVISGNQLNELYTCESNIFSFCGFAIIDPPGTKELEILFTDGDIPSATPEPRQYLLLLTALGACVAADRFRRRRARV